MWERSRATEEVHEDESGCNGGAIDDRWCTIQCQRTDKRILGRLTGDSVQVLIHRYATDIQNVRTNADGVRAIGAECGKVETPGVAVDQLDSADGCSSSGSGDCSWSPALTGASST